MSAEPAAPEGEEPGEFITQSKLRMLLGVVRDSALMRAAMIGYRHAEVCDKRNGHLCGEDVADTIRKVYERLRGER